jgi:hypothetical protein
VSVEIAAAARRPKLYLSGVLLNYNARFIRPRTRKAAAFGELGQPGLLKIFLLSCELIEKVCTDLFYSRHYYAPLR